MIKKTKKKKKTLFTLLRIISAITWSFSEELPHLSFRQLVPNCQNGPHWRIDPGNVIYLQAEP